MKNIINTSELQRKGLKEVYKTIDKYGEAKIVNQRSKKILRLIDDSSPYLLINIIKALKDIKDILKSEYSINKIGIAGSFARGENKPDSDLDILVDFKINDLDKLFELEDFISKKINIKKIDLLSLHNLSPFAAKTIEKEVIYV